MKWLVLFGGNLLGFLIVKYNVQIVRTFGRISWAERKLGPAGTYTFYKLLGILLSVGSFLFFTGQLQNIVGSIAGLFFTK
ncbi:MAG TPA: hypothetical protein ENN77_01440 [Candidatus Wirthbacteria bacterium]|nr:hypothetical protein [Candidatus Wirthbacteria bacterium]